MSRVRQLVWRDASAVPGCHLRIWRRPELAMEGFVAQCCHLQDVEFIWIYVIVYRQMASFLFLSPLFQYSWAHFQLPILSVSAQIKRTWFSVCSEGRRSRTSSRTKKNDCKPPPDRDWRLEECQIKLTGWGWLKLVSEWFQNSWGGNSQEYWHYAVEAKRVVLTWNLQGIRNQETVRNW